LALLIFCLRTDFLATLDEARYIPAGFSHWDRGEFVLANDSPPLARMMAVLPLLPLEVNLASYDPKGHNIDAGENLRDRELVYGGRFANDNPRYFKLFFLARLTGFLWWLLGAWVIVRWSSDLYGGMAGVLALALWCLSPNILPHEQRATPELPTAVICAAATYVFGRYLLRPSWDKALMAGLLLGVAQLVEFVSLALLVIWPLLALVDRLTRGSGSSPSVKLRTRMLQAALAIASSVWVINLGYGFGGSGNPLGSHDFGSGALAGDSQPPGDLPAGKAACNRFRGTWLGRVIIPLPADYLKGLDRRMHEHETALGQRAEGGRPRVVAGSSLLKAGGKVPTGLWVMMLGSLMLMVRRYPSSAPWASELSLWLPILTFLAMTAHAFGPLSTTVGVLLATPFAIVIASKLSRFFRSGRQKVGWLAVGLSLWTIGDSLYTIYAYQFTHENRTRFRQDLGRLSRNLGLPEPKPRTTSPIDAEARGLLYDVFVDSRGVESRYVLFVPWEYRGDRPYPLILFLHGYGDAGKTGLQFTEVGLPFTLKYQEIPFLVLCPQGHSGNWETSGDDSRRAMELLVAVQNEYHVDPKRIYLTGISSGGKGVWDFATQSPDRWAAIVPIASAPVDIGLAPLIKHIPCWCFHNRYDAGSPANNVRKMIEALRAAGGTPKYTEFSDISHNAWDWAYGMPELYDWLLRQRLP